jgi:hypothetical protein
MRISESIPSTSQVARATSLALATGESAMVYEIDYEDTRAVRVGRLLYASDPEFVAFEGEVLVVVEADGTVTY